MAYDDPTSTNPEKYKVIFENDAVRVLEYKDKPGDKTTEHNHPDSIMYTQSAFDRKLTIGDKELIVHKDPGEVSWLPAQRHIGENIGTTHTHVIFLELKK
jgi:beta-alanine degradation protein BauB